MMDANILLTLGYMLPRQLPTGEWAALNKFMFTTGLVVGIDEVGYRTRFCYEHFGNAKAALESWTGEGDPPGPWIKEKGRNGDRANPMTFAGIPVVAVSEL